MQFVFTRVCASTHVVLYLDLDVWLILTMRAVPSRVLWARCVVVQDGGLGRSCIGRICDCLVVLVLVFADLITALSVSDALDSVLPLLEEVVTDEESSVRDALASNLAPIVRTLAERTDVCTSKCISRGRRRARSLSRVPFPLCPKLYADSQSCFAYREDAEKLSAEWAVRFEWPRRRCALCRHVTHMGCRPLSTHAYIHMYTCAQTHAHAQVHTRKGLGARD